MLREELKTLGELLLHWHSSQSDPIYAVGSFFIDGRTYPTPSVVFDALDEIEGLLRLKAVNTSEHEQELRTIQAGLEMYIQDHELVRTDAAEDT